MEENNNELNNNVNPVPENLPVPGTIENVTTEPVPQEIPVSSEPIPVTTFNPSPKKSKTPIIILVLLLLIGAGVAVYFCFFNENKDAGKNKTVTERETKQSPYRLSGNGLENFDLQFLRLEPGNGNVVYSPLSIKYTLAMLNEGTNGESNAQIKALIGDYKATKYTNSNNLSLANAMFVRDDFKDEVKASYTEAINSKYGADVIYDSFTSPSNINKWIKDKTLGLIEDGLDQIPENELFYLVNALAIDMEWKTRFQTAMANYEHTKFGWNTTEVISKSFYGMTEDIASMQIAASFNRSDIIKDKGGEAAFKKEIEKYYIDCFTEMAAGADGRVFDSESVKGYVEEAYNAIKGNYNKSDVSSDFYYYVDENVKVFAKDLKEYDGTTLQYVGFMPIKESLEDFIKNVDAAKLQNYIKNLKFTDLASSKDGVLTYVYGSIPKFKYDYKLDFMNDLKKLGVTDVFSNEKADLSKLVEGKTFINQAIHKATIEMNQDGIKAGAVTLGGGAGNLEVCYYEVELPMEKIDITFDKPYMYLVRNKATGEVWFAGSVYKPTTMAYEEEHKTFKY